ncbi:hypothetical protein QFW96_08660 [Saccharopolyspora sp. TS4A08]|uniref:Uncharacterized protein n=1 Tax=Saccharopolyspora ipomoeae TaxID=3042027 RepID=A0ABT6PL19_9PSEU|nr:hypothetical protein [Saccharopolyspora sp. TS4A08]MDI2028679.1 hypothetical protein [Saccharopolyspora sp. TS4A08]
MADNDPGSDTTGTRSRGQRDSGRYFMLPSETAERFRREERQPETTQHAKDDERGRDD